MKIISRENWHNAFGFYGWQDEIEIKGTMEKYYEMVLWICEHITDPTENVCWIYARGPVFRFRKSKDQAWFMLRWA